jgi:hypothetical protein
VFEEKADLVDFYPGESGLPRDPQDPQDPEILPGKAGKMIQNSLAHDITWLFCGPPADSQHLAVNDVKSLTTEHRTVSSFIFFQGADIGIMSGSDTFEAVKSYATCVRRSKYVLCSLSC